MGAYLGILGIILLLEVGLWVVTREAALGWVVLATGVVGVLLPVVRLLLRRGAPDDKFPWE